MAAGNRTPRGQIRLDKDVEGGGIVAVVLQILDSDAA